MVDKVEETPGSDAQPNDPSSDVAAQPVIDAFGGIRPMAAKLGVPVSTVQGWKQRDTIPAGRVEAIVASAREHDVTLPDLTPKSDASAAEPADEGGAKAASTPPTEPHRPAGPRPPMRFSPPQQPEAQEEQPSAAAPSATTEAAPSRREPEHVADTSPSPAASTGSAAAPFPPEPAAAPAAVAAAPARRGAGGALFLAIVALIVAVLWPIVFSQWLGADAQDGDAAAVDRLAQRITALEQAPAPADTGALQQAIDDLRTQVEALGGGQGGASQETVQALGDRLDALEQAGTDGAAPPAELTQALDSLQQAMNQLDQVVSGLQAKVATIEGQVSALEAGSGGPSTDDLQAALASVQAAVQQIQTKLDDVGQVAESARQQAVTEASGLIDQAVARLNSQIAAVAGTDDAAAEHQAFLLALGQLASRLHTADAFADELAALHQVIASSETLSASLGDTVDEAFAPVADVAADGIPTLAGLRASFDTMRLDVLNASAAAPEDTLDEVWGEISSMVTVSRVDGADPGSVDAILAAAESQLTAGDLAGAVNALAGLAGVGAGYADAAASWIAAAKLRLAADQAVESVYQAALASFRPAPDAGAAPAPSGAAD